MPTLPYVVDCPWPEDEGPSSCAEDGTVIWDGEMGADIGTGIPAAFVILFVLVAALGIAATMWRVSAARRMARESGLDEGDAATMALLSEDGLGATYLASSLRARRPPADPDARTAAGSARPVAERLRELTSLRDQGLITEDEHAARRRAIIDEV
ncbi:SHOCT domain-containing protein [Nocardioides sp. zg-DK7169]|uniref:SHOCT domain-containing protein n=1 Tax=Nocardioides sp. zg-DK7169 TaxID=2736600 RepID=UPI00155712F9|nr:SHOCT domain-containing protein [Nocardioides sp. zg-DK7169]NPC97524.1 SHOCT domain-containing protein [Nocardioides sp. zg-DK7169]